MRFLADMGVSLRVVEWLRLRQDDVVHLREQDLQRLPDAAVFEKATVEGRIILTFDLDFGEIVASSPGATTSVVLFRLRNARTENVIGRLERVLSESSEALRRGAVVTVEDTRHRVRTLPVGGPIPASGAEETRESSLGSTSGSAFWRYVGIDYSGAETPTASLPGLRVYVARGGAEAAEVLPPPSPRRHWTRRGVAEWLVACLREEEPTLVGIDHGFSFPHQYFREHGLAPDWVEFLQDFQRHWPTDASHMYVDFVREGREGRGALRKGNPRWRRLAELRCGAKSVFHFDVPGSVAKSTHAGLPWLLYVRQQVGERVHFWPFDGWSIPAGRSAVVEVYPSLWKRDFPRGDRTDDQQDAFVAAEWMRRADRAGTLGRFLGPRLGEVERSQARIEGWILGVEGK